MALALSLLLAAAPLADVPFDDDFGLVFVQVSVAGSPPLAAILDTGADVTVLDSAAAQRLGLAAAGAHAEAQPGGEVTVATLPPTALTIGTLEIPAVPLVAIPVAGLGDVVGRPIDLILGHTVLERFVVDIDYPNRRLRFHDPAAFRHAGPGLVLPVEITAAEPRIQAAVAMPGGRAVVGRFKLDTGSVDVAGLNANFVRDQEVLPPGTRELVSGGVGIGGATEGRLFRASALVVGDRQLERPLLGYTVAAAGFENRPDAGTIGAGFLARHRLILDYPHARIVLEDVPSARAASREDRSGLRLASPGPSHDTLVVADVAPSSPAAEAGLLPGDEVVSLGGRTGVPLREVFRMLRETGPLPMVVRREGRERDVVLRKRDLLP